MTDSCGRRSNKARATVSPPIAESHTPSGALSMDGNADADAARKRADLEIGWKVAQVRGDVRLGARKEVMKAPQPEPVLHFLPLVAEVRGMNRLEVVRFLLRLEGHHRGDAFPCHEHRPGHRPVGRRLAPARKKKGAQKGTHGPHAWVQGVGDDNDVDCVLRGQPRRSDGQDGRDGQQQPSSSHQRATNTFNLPRSSSTVHSWTPGSRSSPSVCSISGSSGERITSFAVLMRATSRIVMWVPRITRGIARRNRGSETRRIKQTSSLPSAGSASGANR